MLWSFRLLVTDGFGLLIATDAYGSIAYFFIVYDCL